MKKKTHVSRFFYILVFMGSIFSLNSCKDDTPIPSPVASFKVSEKPILGQVITFTNTSINANEFIWDFGDGTKSTELNPSHIYLEKGNHVVSLIANGNGGTDETTQTINVLILPTASFTYSGITVTNNEITFFNSSLNASSYHWNFGDQNSSTEKDPKYTYTETGDYTVTLIAQNEAGLDTLNLVISICEPKVFEGDIILLTQEEVDSFGNKCYTSMTGGIGIGFFERTTNITDLSPLKNLTSVEGILSIESNDLLTNLNGLENLTEVSGGIKINSNFSLIDYCGIKDLLQNVDPNNITITANKFNPTVMDIINGNCSE